MRFKRFAWLYRHPCIHLRVGTCVGRDRPGIEYKEQQAKENLKRRKEMSENEKPRGSEAQ